MRDSSAVHTTLRLARGVGTLTIDATLRVTTSSRTAALNALCNTIHAWCLVHSDATCWQHSPIAQQRGVRRRAPLP